MNRLGLVGGEVRVWNKVRAVRGTEQHRGPGAMNKMWMWTRVRMRIRMRRNRVEHNGQEKQGTSRVKKEKREMLQKLQMLPELPELPMLPKLAAMLQPVLRTLPQRIDTGRK